MLVMLVVVMVIAVMVHVDGMVVVMVLMVVICVMVVIDACDCWWYCHGGGDDDGAAWDGGSNGVSDADGVTGPSDCGSNDEFCPCSQNTRHPWLLGSRCYWSFTIQFPSWSWQWRLNRMSQNRYMSCVFNLDLSWTRNINWCKKCFHEILMTVFSLQCWRKAKAWVVTIDYWPNMVAGCGFRLKPVSSTQARPANHSLSFVYIMLSGKIWSLLVCT